MHFDFDKRAAPADGEDVGSNGELGDARNGVGVAYLAGAPNEGETVDDVHDVVAAAARRRRYRWRPGFQQNYGRPSSWTYHSHR